MKKILLPITLALLSGCTSPTPAPPSDSSPPKITLKASGGNFLADQPIELEGAASDPESGIRSVVFSVKLPDGSAETIAEVKKEPHRASYTPTKAGRYTFSASTTNGQDLKAFATTTVDVADPSAPELTLKLPQGTKVGQQATLEAQSADPQSGVAKVRFHISGPEGFSMEQISTSQPHQATFTPKAAGTYLVKATATNGMGMEVAREGSLQVAASDGLPQPVDLPPTLAVNGLKDSYDKPEMLKASIEASDDHGLASISGSLSNGAGTKLPLSQGISGKTFQKSLELPLTSEHNGSWTLSLEVKDSSGQVAVYSRTIKIQIPANPPADEVAPSLSIEVLGMEAGIVSSSPLQVRSTASDANLKSVVAITKLASGRAIEQQLKADETISIPVTEADDGAGTITVTASDGSNQTVRTASFTIRIAAAPPPADTTPPQASIEMLGLVNGEATTSPINYSYTASDANLVSVKAVTKFANGRTVSQDLGSSGSTSIPVEPADNGPATTTLTAWDGSNETVKVASYQVALPLPDKTPPQISLDVPSKVTAYGRYTLSAKITDDRALGKASGSISGQGQSFSFTLPAAGGSYDFDVVPGMAGTYILKVEATDAAGNAATASREIVIAVP